MAADDYELKTGTWNEKYAHFLVLSNITKIASYGVFSLYLNILSCKSVTFICYFCDIKSEMGPGKLARPAGWQIEPMRSCQ